MAPEIVHKILGANAGVENILKLLPGGSPNNADFYAFQGSLPDHRRVNLGISYIFVDRNSTYPKHHWMDRFKEFSLGFEIFNLFNNQSSITNTWVRDVDTQNQFAIPNF